MLKRFENVSMMVKVAIPTAVMLVAALGIVLLAERGLGRLAAQTHHIINVVANRQALSLAMSASLNSVAASEKNAMLMTDKEGLDVFASAYVSEVDHLRDDVAQLIAVATDRAEIDRLDRIVQGIDGYAATGRKLYQLMLDRQFEAAHALSTGAAQDARMRLIGLIKEEIDQTGAAMRAADAAADTLYRRTFGLVAALSIGGLVLALMLVHYITTGSIMRPLIRITDAMERISRDDLAVEIDAADRRDEIGVLGRALAVFRARSVALHENSQRLKKAHDEIAALNGVLEKRVEERTAALNAAHRELLMKERLSSLGRLTPTIVHELRNPLSTLRNTVHAIGRIVGERGVDVERQIGRCQRTIERCDGFVNDLLDFAGERELHAVAMNLDAWLGETLDAIAVSAPVALERRLDAPQAVVGIDSERLRCAIVNVIDNAIEAFADAEAAMERRIAVSTSAGDRAEIVIADSGPGMPEPVLARALEPLYSTRAFGTGLGLPTAQRIVEQHGGEIAIASAPGSGTSVTLRLPLAPAKARPAAA